MIIISHRGNIGGPNTCAENNPKRLSYLLNKYSKLHIEIDVWSFDNTLYLGHDNQEYKIDPSFLINPKLWCHAKNLEALDFMSKQQDIHYFWHETDTVTITSQGIIWCYPGVSHPFISSILVKPEEHNIIIPDGIFGICTDYANKYL